MGYVDFILNLAGLLLWLNWRSIRFDPLGKRTPATLIGTLRRAEPERLRRWHPLAALAGLLLVRAGIYWQIGSATKPVWAGKLDLGVIVLSIPCHEDWSGLGRIVLFSFFSFGLMLGVFYLWLLLLSILARPDPPTFHRLVRMQLGRIDRWPRAVKWFLPLLVTTSCWWLFSWVFTWLNVIPAPVSPAHRLEEAMVIGLGSYLAWKYVAGALLALHLLNSFIYFGKHPFWRYIDAIGHALLQPVRWIGLVLRRAALSCLPRTSPWRTRKVNLSPALKLLLTLLLDVVGIVLVFLLAELAGRGLGELYRKLPL